MNTRRYALPALLLAIVFSVLSSAYASTLTLTVFTTKPSYVTTDDITVYGTLTYDGSLVVDWSVAIEVHDPLGTLVVTRTVQTNTSGTYTLKFRLPTNSRFGTYSVYVSSSFKGETATNNTTFEIVPVRDIAVTDLAASKTIVGQSYSMHINVTAENQGEVPETFNLTAYANTTSIATQAVALPNGRITTVTFTWNTTGFAKGNYTISAYAWPLPSETDAADNTCVGGQVTVAMIGDVSGLTLGVPDGKVDVRDLAYIAKLYGVDYPDPRYNANCDLTGPTLGVADGKIDIRDLAATAKNFGKIDP